jgi:hypothetical protein
MPSYLISNRSGGDLLWSGAPYSGTPSPVGGIYVTLDSTASGNAYIAYSGGITVRSGGVWLSGTAGSLDGVPVFPGGSFMIPEIAIRKVSGNVNVYVQTDPAGSGQARLYYEVY